MANLVENSTIIEEREEFMVSHTGGLATLRKAHFLKPTITPIEGQPLRLPVLNPKSKWPLKVAFNGWNDPLRKWKTWVHNMHSRYSSIWKETGIYEALMASTYKIIRNEDLILGFAERWCSDTNTFIFPWGEATITLEDLLILGGYSVMGDSVLSDLGTEDQAVIEELLEERRKNLAKLKKDTHLEWLCLFMGTGSRVEHEAFLSLWLSRCVFPGYESEKIGSYVFPIAILLAKGRRLALAPSVLASIYRDLGLLKEAMAASVGLSEGYYTSLILSSPLHFVQVWAWERLPSLQPQPNLIAPGVVRVARWDRKKGFDEVENVRLAVNSAVLTFLWRPFALPLANWSFPIFYNDNEAWLKCADLSLEFEAFARCLRASVLVGVDCQESYNPHRVAMQFGFDQDLPGWIRREDTNLELEWYNYSKSLSGDEMLYVPSRHWESDVSSRYLEWWRKKVIYPVTPFPRLLKGLRSSRKRRECKDLKLVFESNVFPQKNNIICCDEIGGLKTSNDPEIPPGFEHLYSGIKTNGYSSAVFNGCNDEMNKKEGSSSCDGDNDVSVSVSTCFRSLSSTFAADGSCTKVVNLDESKDVIQNDMVEVGCADVIPGFGFSSNFNVRNYNSSSVAASLQKKKKLSSLNDVREVRSSEVADKFLEAPREHVLSKSVDVLPGLALSSKFNNVGKHNVNSAVAPVRKGNTLSGNVSHVPETSSFASAGFSRKVQPQQVTKQVIGSVTGAEYMHKVSTEKGSAFNKSQLSDSLSARIATLVGSHDEVHFGENVLRDDDVVDNDAPPGFGFPGKHTVRKRLNNNSVLAPLRSSEVVFDEENGEKLCSKNGEVSDEPIKARASVPATVVRSHFGENFVQDDHVAEKRSNYAVEETPTGSSRDGDVDVDVPPGFCFSSKLDATKRNGNNSVSTTMRKKKKYACKKPAKVDAPKNSNQRRMESSTSSDLEARIAMIKARVSTIQGELAALKSSENGLAGDNHVL